MDMRKLLIISLDTYRKDNIGKVVNGVLISPFMTEIVRQSTFYNNYYASCNWTIPAYASMFTGEPTVAHNFWGYRRFPGQPVDLIFDELANADIRPSLLCCGVLAESDVFQYRSQKYAATTYDTRKLDGMINLVVNQLEKCDLVFFHTFLMHDYFHHYNYTSQRYGIRRQYEFIGEDLSRIMGGRMRLWREEAFPMTLEDLAIVERMYYNECLLVDSFVSVLFHVVLSRFPDVEIIINTDHGECFSHCGKRSFDEHWNKLPYPLWHHSTGFCFEQFEVFAIRYQSGIPGGVVDNTLIDHEDIYRIILGKFGLSGEEIGGKSFNLISTSYDKVGYCGILKDGEVYLYDRNRDFEFILKDKLCSNDIGEADKDKVAYFRDILRSRSRDAASYAEANEEVRMRLKGFGYM